MIIISRYSGKCDCHDYFDDRTDDYIKNSKIYLGDNPIPLRIENQHDLAPYYPYLVASMGADKDGCVCHLTDRSYVDSEEEEHLGWKLRDFKKYYRKCKRTKIPYDVDTALKKCCFFEPKEVDRQIAERVGMYGEKATIEGLHDDMHQYYRQRLFDEMIRLGWDERAAGYWIYKDWKWLIKKEGNDAMNG